MSKLSQGEVTVSVDSTEYVLKPTLSAIKTISRVYKGMGGAFEALRQADFDAVVNIIRVGAHLDTRDARHLEDQVFAEMGRDETAFGDLILQLIEYIRVLQNGGKPLPEQENRPAKAPAAAQDAEGNF